MITEAFLLVLGLVTLITSVAAIWMNSRCWIELKAMQSSTHKVHFLSPQEILDRELGVTPEGPRTPREKSPVMPISEEEFQRLTPEQQRALENDLMFDNIE